jgi:hypothetical protein
LLALPASGAAAGYPSQAEASAPVSEIRTADGDARPGAASQPVSYAHALRIAAVEHAPLAYFSLGSLAVGAVFYGINSSNRPANTIRTADDRTQITAAVGVAGLTALLAAGAYCYYVRKSAENSRDWEASMTGGVSGDGDVNVGALLTLPLAFFSR